MPVCSVQTRDIYLFYYFKKCSKCLYTNIRYLRYSKLRKLRIHFYLKMLVCNILVFFLRSFHFELLQFKRFIFKHQRLQTFLANVNSKIVYIIPQKFEKHFVMLNLRQVCIKKYIIYYKEKHVTLRKSNRRLHTSLCEIRSRYSK